MTLRICALALAALAIGCDSPNDPPDPIEELREATEPFKQVSAALAAGYAPAGPCVATPAGAMGIHYTNPSLLDAIVDPRRPEVLLYAPTAGGGRELIGAEFVVAADAWDASNTALPALAGQSFDDHRAPAARHGLPFAHYDLHVWVWKANPAGMFAPFNSTVSCS
jgi:hypothetical protein